MSNSETTTAQLTLLSRRLERAERALVRAGWTYTEGAEEWKPPLGQSALPLLDELDRLRAQVEDKGAATVREENARLRTAVEYWRLAAERRQSRKDLTGLDIPEARTLDEPEVTAQVERTTTGERLYTLAEAKMALEGAIKELASEHIKGDRRG